MNPYELAVADFHVKSLPELYAKLKTIARDKMGLRGVPFTLNDLENPPGNKMCPEIFAFIQECVKAHQGDNSDEHAIKLIKYLKENPPKEIYENPKVSNDKLSKEDKNLIRHIFYYGIDLPGSRHCPFGHLQYFSSFFIDMYFGNYSEFNDHVKSLSKRDLMKAMKKREGHCQQSPIFAPILGLRLGDFENRPNFTKEEKLKIKTMYNLNNENRNLDIMLKLIDLGADVNAHDINGFTPLHYASAFAELQMIIVLLKHGANPNSENRVGHRPLSFSSNRIIDSVMNELIYYGARVTSKQEIMLLRSNTERYGSKELAIKVREAHPRDKEECEKCVQPATKKCSACGLVYYCTPSCQKLDWKFHKDTCKKNKRPIQ